MVRVVQISDTHINRRGGVPSANLQRCIDFINDEIRPDLVVHTGDVVSLTPGVDADLQTARQLLGQLTARLLVIPGNHDIGESCPDPWMGFATEAISVSAFRGVFGRGYWLELLDEHWAAIGLSDELFSSGIADEAEQWEWIDRTALEFEDRNVILFMHRPLWSKLEELELDESLAVAAKDRERLLRVFKPGRLRAVAAGHLHRFLHVSRNGVSDVWAPSTACLLTQLTSSGPPVPGLNRLGVMEYRLEGDDFEVEVHAVPGLDEREMQDIPEILEELGELVNRPS